MYVIGTAGHVDHGKSTLVKALTGIDPDRLKEEQQRAMTIDLGFAWLNLPSGKKVGLVDVPGHQDFIKNMLAGVGGIDAALLIIAADEGVMPQTREHVAILDLLEVPRAIVVVTKMDTVEADWLELVQADITTTLAKTRLAQAPLIPVSALKGHGLQALWQQLEQTLSSVPPRQNRGRPRLPIDRVFSISGFGTVVTGTLLDGSLSVGQEVEISPTGLKSRIRGLQSHKEKVTEIGPGARVAVNLTHLSTAEIARGQVLTLPDWLEPSQLIDVHLRLLPDAPRPLRHNQAIDFFTGAAEVTGHIRLLGVAELKAGESGWVQLRLAQRIAVMKGDHFIIRQPSPSMTLGGGVVVNPLPRRRHRRFRAETIAQLETLLAGTPEELILNLLDRRVPLTMKLLLGEVGLPQHVATQAVDNLWQQQVIFSLSGETDLTKTLITSHGGWARLWEQMKAELSDYHARFPLRLGLAKIELKSRLKLETRLFNEALRYGEQKQLLITSDTWVKLPHHELSFTPTQQRKIEELIAEMRRNPYSTPLPKDMAGQVSDEVLQALLDEGRLMRLSPEVILLRETYLGFLNWLKDYLSREGQVNVGQVRDAWQTSRKYALALLEYTDEQKVTKRVGDNRVAIG